MSKSTEEVRKALFFNAYDLDEKKQVKRASAGVFNLLRQIARTTKDKPDKAEKAGSWKKGAQIQLDLSDLEHSHKEKVRLPSNLAEEIDIPVIVMDPRGAIIVWPEGTWDQLHAYVEAWLKEAGDKGGATNAQALDIHLLYEWMEHSVVSVPLTTETGVRIGCSPEERRAFMESVKPKEKEADQGAGATGAPAVEETPAATPAASEKTP